jgi:BON domain
MEDTMSVVQELKRRKGSPHEDRRAGRVRGPASSATKAIRSGAEPIAGSARRLTSETRAALSGGRSRSKTRIAAAVAGAAGTAAAALYFLDPRNGSRRRRLTRDRAAKLVGLGPNPDRVQPNDPAIADRVKSELFRPADSPKDTVDVSVENGVVYLRGEVDGPGEIAELVETARRIDGVRGVESLLHTPGTEAPTESNGRAAASR